MLLWLGPLATTGAPAQQSPGVRSVLIKLRGTNPGSQCEAKLQPAVGGASRGRRCRCHAAAAFTGSD